VVGQNACDYFGIYVMKGTILLNYNENIQQVIEEEKNRFLYHLFEQMGLPIHEFWDANSILTVENKIKLRKILEPEQIQIMNYADGLTQVYIQNKLIGEWRKPFYKIKRDFSKIDKKKQLYLEMHLDFWTIYDEDA
jgi:hypothetical protein